MGELTNKRLEEIKGSVFGLKSMTETEQMQMISELLALRSRDAGDEELNWCREELAKTDEELRLIKDLNENHDIAITRGQQLREAREEIERLKSRKIECCTCGHEMAEVDGQFGCEHCDHEYDGTCECWQCHHSREHESMQSQIATLTAERDRYKNLYHEAVVILEQIDKSNDESLEIGEESWERMKSMINDPDAVKIEDISLFEEGYNSRQPEIDSLTSELAALKSSPSMAEVDALMEAISEAPNLSPRMKSAALKGADIARRSIASREEVVEGLLAVESLILESKGVAGLHLNGDLAEWDELRSGGRFGDWLYKFDDALEIARSGHAS